MELVLESPSIEDIELEFLLQALYLRYHYDFRHYARASLKRRLAEARERLGFANSSELQGAVLRDPALLAKLLHVITVPTTEMFRDPPFFRVLREQVLPYLHSWPSLKIWIAGASTGEEVWSIAILLHEANLLDRTLLYATDINPRALATARRGIYSAETVRQAIANYQDSGGAGTLSDHYRAAYDAVQFDPGLLRNCVFSDHNLATDSVFAEVHLVTCRNVLIYFDRALQQRAVGLFRDSLVHGGILGIGSKETLEFSGHRCAFEPVAEPQRVYRRSRR